MADGRCAECGAAVSVSDDYAHGSQVRCGSCQTSLRVLRGEGLRLVHADVDPLREALQLGQRRQKELQAELARARASVGIGVNGLGLGLLYLIAKVGLEEQPLTTDLMVTALIITLAAGVALELANLLFLAKRQQISRLSEEVSRIESDNRHLQRQLRNAMRR